MTDTIVSKELSYFFSSATVNGAVQKSSNGDVFSVQLNSPISIPREAINATLEVTSAAIWNNINNISAAIGNNKLYVHRDATSFTITIPDGLYGISELIAVFSREFVNNTQPSDLIVFNADGATQKLVLDFAYANTWLDFTPADSCRLILGFNSRRVPLVDEAKGYEEYADNPAEFNRTNSFLIKTDLISNGVPVNNISDGTIAEVLISSKPGSQILYAPYHPVRSDAVELIGKSKNYFTFRLTDQTSRSVETNGEDWSFTVVIRYSILHKHSTHHGASGGTIYRPTR